MRIDPGQVQCVHKQMIEIQLAFRRATPDAEAAGNDAGPPDPPQQRPRPLRRLRRKTPAEEALQAGPGPPPAPPPRPAETDEQQAQALETVGVPRPPPVPQRRVVKSSCELPGHIRLAVRTLAASPAGVDGVKVLVCGMCGGCGKDANRTRFVGKHRLCKEGQPAGRKRKLTAAEVQCMADATGLDVAKGHKRRRRAFFDALCTVHA